MLAATGVDPTGLARWMKVWEKTNRLADDTSRLNLDRKQAVLSTFHALQSAMKA